MTDSVVVEPIRNFSRKTSSVTDAMGNSSHTVIRYGPGQDARLLFLSQTLLAGSCDVCLHSPCVWFTQRPGCHSPTVCRYLLWPLSNRRWVKWCRCGRGLESTKRNIKKAETRREMDGGSEQIVVRCNTACVWAKMQSRLYTKAWKCKLLNHLLQRGLSGGARGQKRCCSEKRDVSWIKN